MEYKGAIPRDFIETLLSRADIVEVINQRVPLKKAGATYKACCPFHQEKSPSFNVSPVKQFYHCFGCGASGDALKFIMEYEGLSFIEAVESLATQVGLEVPRVKQTPQAAKQAERSRDFYEVMAMVAKFYRQQLRDHANAEQAKTYLRNRGLTAEIAKTFLIGYAPPGWDSLVSGLKADAKLKAQLVEMGMLIQKDDGKLYDRFRQRIMFPIRDGRGRVVAFGGRVLSSEDQPKYLNSPETPIFHKSYALYGLYELRQSRQKFDNIIVVEGYMDVVALAQFGVRNAVATLGTATTVDHLQMLFRQVDEVVFCFDGDAAGLKAAWKALELALPMLEQTRSVKFLFLPQGEDPDSMVRAEGAEGFLKRASEAMTLSQFLLSGVQDRVTVSMQLPEGQQQFVALLQPFLQLAQENYRRLLLEQVSQVVGFNVWLKDGRVQVGRRHQAQLEKMLSAPARVSQVMSLAKHLVCILLVRPVWAGVLAQAVGDGLAQSTRRDDQLLRGVLNQLMQTYDAQSAINWMQHSGFAEEYAFIAARTLPQDDESLRQMFEETAARLLDELEKMSLTQQDWSRQALAELQAFFAARK